MPAPSTEAATAATLSGSKFLVFVEQQAGAEHEVTGVPQIAFLDVAFRGFGVRLFDEFFDGENVGTDRRAGADIAVLGRRARRPRAERHDMAGRGGVRRKPADLGEGRRIGHHVIGGERHDHRIAAALDRETPRPPRSPGRNRAASARA